MLHIFEDRTKQFPFECKKQKLFSFIKAPRGRRRVLTAEEPIECGMQEREEVGWQMVLQRLVGKVHKGRETIEDKWKFSKVSCNGLFFKALNPQTSFKYSPICQN